MSNRERPLIAALGGSPSFTTPIHVAQVNLPCWEDVEAEFRGIFERKYFANHGPMVRQLDEAFAEAEGVRHAICVTNGTMALMVLCKALGLSGSVIVPAFTFPATAQALLWAGLEPVFCDVNPDTHTISADLVEPLLTQKTSGILGVHAWGKPCDPDGLQEICRSEGIKLFFDACHAIGCSFRGKSLAGVGDGAAFSFHATKIINAGEGGCVTTNDDELAARLRTIRSFHPSETFVPGLHRFNAKMSEAQAALALLSLRDLQVNIAANRERYEAYVDGLQGIPGLSILSYPDPNNYQYIVIEIDEEDFGMSRDCLYDALHAENVICRRHFFPGAYRTSPFSEPNCPLDATENLMSTVLQLPNGQAITHQDISRVCECIIAIRDARDRLHDSS